MTSTSRALCTVLVGAAALVHAACGSSPPSSPTPAPVGAGGSGGSAGGRPTIPDPSGSGGAPGAPADPPPAAGPDAGAPPADAAPAGPAMPPPAAEAEQPLPPCKRTVPAASTAELATGIAGAQPGDCIVLADGNYTFPAISKTATEAEPIVIRAANRGKAVVNAGAIQFLKAAYVVVEGLDITTPGAATGMYNGGSNGMIVAFMDSHHCRLSRSRHSPLESGGRARLGGHRGRREPSQPDRPQRPGTA